FPNHSLGHASQDESSYAFSAVGRHYDGINAQLFNGLDDPIRWLTINFGINLVMDFALQVSASNFLQLYLCLGLRYRQRIDTGRRGKDYGYHIQEADDGVGSLGQAGSHIQAGGHLVLGIYWAKDFLKKLCHWIVPYFV